jgi:outer membrane protein OmpA-like peptidoglycan-associated protein
LLLFFSFLNFQSSHAIIQDSIFETRNSQPEIDTNRLKNRYGIFGHYGPVLNIASFQNLPGVNSCCPKYGFTTSQGFDIGALFEMPFDTVLGMQIRGSFSYFFADFESLEDQFVVIDQSGTTATFSHSLNTEFFMIGIDPLISYRFWKELNLYGGLSFRIPITTEYSTVERITTDMGTFGDGRRTRNFQDGDIESSKFMFGIALGAGYDLPLQKRPGLFLTPEILLKYYPGGPVSDTDWQTFDIRGGIALKYRTPPVPPPPPPPPAAPPLPELPMPTDPPTINASLKVFQRDSSGNTIADNELMIEDFVSFNMRPLLNYVFFDEGSDTIPERYQLLESGEVRRFRIDNLRKSDDLETYYNVLNIVGGRMRSNPDITITITGNNSDEGVEKDNRQLSENRAKAVYNYLKNNWAIDPSRMDIKARDLPRQASRTDTLPGYQENRRVEITSDFDDISKPVMTNDTIRQITKTKFVFKPEADSEIDIRDWKLTAKQGERVLFEKQGTGDLPDSIVWDPEESGANLRNAQTIFCELQVWDKLGNNAESDQKSISINQLTVDRKRMERRRDKEFEYYGLILFDYGKTSLNREHRKTVDFVKSRIATEDTVTVLGYSDAMGDEITNKKIADRRATSVARYLRHPRTATFGIGEEELIFDNELPEGRFYCRTVRISVESEVGER